MSISEILMLLTLIVTIVHVTFEITWKLEQREKHHDLSLIHISEPTRH